MGINEQLLVSIGLPVFNGEKGLESAINSLLEQDYSNFEIIISDNGSTDSTPKICETFVGKDKRIKYFRSEENRGTIWNFNRVFELSSGEYFMWAADDDSRSSDFISKCVNELDLNKKAVMCCPYMNAFVEGDDRPVYISTLNSFAAKTSLVDRYYETINNFSAIAMYGIYRSVAIKKTKKMQAGIIASDLCFIRELSFYGVFIQVPEVLFSYYMREKWNSKQQDFKVFFGNANKPWWYIPFIMVLLTNIKDILSSDISIINKIKLLFIVVFSEIKRLNKRLFVKVMGKILGDNMKKRIAYNIYSKLFLNKNLIIKQSDTFYKRIVLPQLGW